MRQCARSLPAIDDQGFRIQFAIDIHAVRLALFGRFFRMTDNHDFQGLTHFLSSIQSDYLFLSTLREVTIGDGDNLVNPTFMGKRENLSELTGEENHEGKILRNPTLPAPT